MPDFLDDLVLALTLQAIAMSVPGQNHFLILSTSEQKFVTRLVRVDEFYPDESADESEH